MREQPDDLTVVGRLLAGADGWTGAAPADVPPSWRSLLDLDDRSLDTEASELLAGLVPAVGPIDVAVESVVGDIVAQSLEKLWTSGWYTDAPDIEIDVTLTDVSGADVLGAVVLGGDVLGELAVFALDPLVVADAGPVGIVDPFLVSIDADSAPADSIGRPPAAGLDEPVDLGAGAAKAVDPGDDLVDDIAGAGDLPLRVEFHDPFDAIGSPVVEPEPAPDVAVREQFPEHDLARPDEPIDLTNPPFDSLSHEPVAQVVEDVDDMLDLTDDYGTDG